MTPNIELLYTRVANVLMIIDMFRINKKKEKRKSSTIKILYDTTFPSYRFAIEYITSMLIIMRRQMIIANESCIIINKKCC